MNIHVPYDDYKWYGEPPDEMRDEFFHQAKLMHLDDYTTSGASEPLSTRYWRRYGLQAIELLERIREDPTQAEIIIKGTEYTHCELYLAAQREMITKLEDFLRRRSKIALVARKQDIMNSPGLMDACQILFGEQAQAKFDEYFHDLKAAEAEVAAAKGKSKYMDKLSEESHADNPAHSEALNWT